MEVFYYELGRETSSAYWNMGAPQERKIQYSGMPDGLLFYPSVEPKPQGPSCKIPDMKKFEKSIERYDTDLLILGRLLEFEGIRPKETLERERQEAISTFRQSDRATRIETHGVIIQMIEEKLPHHISSQLALSRELTEDTKTSASIKEEEAKLKNRSRFERFQALIGLKSDNDNTLMERMPTYIGQLKDILIRTGRSEPEVDGEIGIWSQRYDIVPSELKPKVANRVRQRVRHAVRNEFKSLLLDYGFLSVTFKDPRQKTIQPSEWQSIFDEADSSDKEVDIVRALRHFVEKRRAELKFKFATVRITSSIT